tara:strand:+ start:249 stop:644 length:396 start_codon:yes stop_codon:yes gene_type:complete
MNFNTTRFIDVSTSRQSANGTTVFHDTDNPGVFYASYSSGNVRRIIQTTTQTSSPISNTSSNHTTSYNINHRNTNPDHKETFVSINSVNGRLGRIAEMADKFNSRRNCIINTTVNGDIVTVTTPRIVNFNA